MKRIFSFIAACATMFALAACQEELQQPVEQPVVPGVEGELQQVTFSVSVPQDPQTKAISDGMKATNLEYAVYRAEAYSYTDDAGKTETYPAGEYIPALSQGANAKVTEMHTTDELKWEVVLTLAKNVKYDIVFWAYADDAPYTFDEPNAQIKVNDKYEGPANDDTRDAFFYRCDEYAVITSDTKVELRRPFAQINFGSSDYDPYITDLHLKMTSTFDTDAHAAKDAVYENDDPDGRLLYPAVPAVAATKLPTVLNVLDGSVSGEEIVKFMTTPIPYENGVDQVLMVTDQDGDETTTTDQTTYHWMSMNYVLAGEEATIDNIHAVFTYNNQDLEINVPNVPFKRNYKTNIIGNLFTEEAKFNVVVVPDYYTPDYIYDMDLTLAEAFTQNRDVEFTLTEDTVIEEPLILDNGRTLTLNLDEYSITTETGLWNTANGVWSMISVRNGSTLVINSEGGKVVAMKDDAYAVDVRDGSTLTINGGEYVGNISAVYVHDGTANINGGSYSILQLAEEANGGDERFTLNCEDGAYRDGKAVINVTGGSFVNYDPSDNLAEGQNTNFVAAGYVAVPSEVEGKTVYTVKKNAVLAAVAAGSDAVTIEGTEEFVKPVMIESGKTFTLTLGDEAVLTSLNTDPDTHASVFEVHGELVIEGNGTVDAGSNAASNIAVWARGEGAKVTIKSGNFKSGVDSEGQSSPVIYASKPATIEIYGGTFEAAPNNNDFANKPTYPALNLHGSVEKTATITVYGGTFVNFNPANPGTESAEWIAAHPNGFVADGYTVESEEKDGKTYYTVVEKPALVITPIKDVETGKEYTVEGTVVAVGVKAYFVSDGTGNLLVYGADHGRTLMEKVRLTGATSRYKDDEANSIQLSVSSAELISTNNSWTYNPTVLDGSSLSDRIGQTSTAEEVQFAGVMSVGTYANITVDGASKSASLYYVNASDYAKFDGKKVIVKGYVTGQGSYFNVLPYSVELMSADWALRGIGGDWGTDYPMYEVGDWYVAENVALSPSDEFKFSKDNWSDNRGGQTGIGTSVYYAGKDWGNITVGADGSYDIYLNTNLSYYSVIPAGSAVPEISWSVYGPFGGSAEWVDVDMTYKNGWYVVEDVALSGSFLLRLNKEWNLKLASAGTELSAIDSEIPVAVNGGSDLKSTLSVANGELYDLYLKEDLSVIKATLAAAEPAFTPITLTFPEGNQKSISSYTETWEAIVDNHSWSISNFNNNSNKWAYIKCGRKNNDSVGYIKTYFEETVSSVTVSVDAVTLGNVNSTKLEVSTVDDFSDIIETVNVTIAKGDNTYSISNPQKNCYYRLVFDCSSASSNGVITISKVLYE